jgi:type IV pilus assembly protein PilC
MAKFSYIARTKDGSRDTGTIEAKDQDSAISILQKKGLIVTSIVQFDITSPYQQKKKKDTFGRLSSKKFGHGGVRAGDLVIFARQLAMLLGAGVSLLKSLEIILKQVDSKRLYEVIVAVTREMEGGRTFKDSLLKYKSVFSELWVYLIETGEASGNLPTVLEHLAKYLEDRQAFKRKIISALMYPAILFVVAVGAVMFFVVKIVPTFSEILLSFNVELPLPTKILIAISNGLRKRLILIILVIAGVIFLFKKLMKMDLFRAKLEKVQLKLPIFGNFFRFMMIEGFSTTMSILIDCVQKYPMHK